MLPRPDRGRCERHNTDPHPFSLLLSPSASFTPRDALDLNGPTRSFLCPLSANIYGIDFLSFIIRDYESKSTLFEVSRDRPLPQNFDFASFDEDSLRTIKYEFSEDILKLPTISTELIFSVGQMEVTDFRMIERHYFRDRLIKSFDFTFGFCIPGSTNTWEAVYALPAIPQDVMDDIIANPYETTSDSFYFVGDRLIMHNKAKYKYVAEDAAQDKRSYDHYNTGAKGSKGSKSAGDKAGGEFDADDKEDSKADSKAASKFADDDENDIWSKDSDYF